MRDGKREREMGDREDEERRKVDRREWEGGRYEKGAMEIRSRGESGRINLAGCLRLQKCVINYKRDKSRWQFCVILANNWRDRRCEKHSSTTGCYAKVTKYLAALATSGSMRQQFAVDPRPTRHVTRVDPMVSGDGIICLSDEMRRPWPIAPRPAWFGPTPEYCVVHRRAMLRRTLLMTINTHILCELRLVANRGRGHGAKQAVLRYWGQGRAVDVHQQSCTN